MLLKAIKKDVMISKEKVGLSSYPVDIELTFSLIHCLSFWDLFRVIYSASQLHNNCSNHRQWKARA